MAGPQTENGYTRIANELLEAILQHPFSKRELFILLAIIRKTYGYNKKTDYISLSQLANMTGIDRANTSRTVNNLVAKKVLLKQQQRNIQVIGISKNYNKWKSGKQVLPKRHVAKTATQCCQNGNLPVAKMATTKDTLTKDNITKVSTGQKKPGATKIKPDWLPDEKAVAWIVAHGVTLQQAQPVILEFRTYWLQRTTRRVNWSLAFMRNGFAETGLLRIKANGAAGPGRQSSGEKFMTILKNA